MINPMLTRTTLAATIAYAVVLGCGPDPASRSTPPAEVPGALLDLRIDGYDADLVPITWLGVSSSGVIALAQAQDRNVRFFDPSGAALGTFGQDGEGPGEFRMPARGGWIGDTLWMSDTRLNRVTLIGPDLQLLGTISPPSNITFRPGEGAAEVQFGATAPYALFGRDTLLIVANSGPRLTENPQVPIFRTTSGGAVVNEVAWVPVAQSATASTATDRGNVFFRVPFSARSTWSTSPDGHVIAVLTHDESGPSFHVLAVDLNGHVQFDLSFSFEPIQISATRIDSAVAASPPALRHAVRKATPTTYPGAERVLVGRDHRVWVGLWPDARGQRWIVLSQDGMARDSISLPPRVYLQAADSVTLWAIQRDEVDVESVVRYRLNGAGR